MKKILKAVGIILAVMICLFLIFLAEESIRLKADSSAQPLFILDKTKYSVSDIRPGEELEVNYYSIGYKSTVRYFRPEESSGDSDIMVTGKEFMLFNKFRLWAWIS